MVFSLLCFRDGRLHAGDELLMINSQSLVGLTHQEAVDVLRSTAGLIQLVVASKVQPMNRTANASHSSLDFRSIEGFCTWSDKELGLSFQQSYDFCHC